ncbi:MAG: rnhA operon protein [Halanaeroarchaeum sp.]
MPDLPEDAVEEATRLTRLAGDAVDETEASAYRERRDSLLAEYGYEARVREEDDGETLVCYPSEWLDGDGTVDFDAVDDLDRGVERRLSGRGAQGDWASANEHNREIVATVADDHDPVHAENARAFADFMGNHYARPIPTATETELAEFLTEYYPRNAWPTDEQTAVVEQSLRIVFEKTGTSYPLD